MRFDLDALLQATGLTIAQMSEHLDVDRQKLYRWQRRGLDFAQADELAVAFGLVPYEIWSDYLDVDISGPLTPEEERRQHELALYRQRRRRYRARNPHVRQYDRELSRKTYHANPEVARLSKRIQYRQNHDRELARMADYRRRNRDAINQRQRERRRAS